MTATYTTNLRITKQGDNDNPSTWGQVVNTQIVQLIEDSITRVNPIDCTGTADVNIASTTVNGGTDDARTAVIELIGTIGNDISFIIPAVDKIYLIRAAHTGGFNINVKPVGGSTSISFPTGKTSIIYTHGTSIHEFSVPNALIATNNLSDVTNPSTALFNISGQPLDAGLTALAALVSTGILASTSANTFATRTITGTANQVTVTNGDGIAGDPTLALNIGILANQLIQLNASAQLPAVDGSLLTGIVKPVSSSNKVVLGSLTVQWGLSTTGTSSPTITFPTAFSSAPTFVGCQSNASTSQALLVDRTLVTATNFVGRQFNTNSGAAQSGDFSWIAIGPT